MSNENEEIYLHAEKIDKIYPGTKALDQVSFDIKRGKVNVLIGENGAGKSTLMRFIAGIEKPSAGKEILKGINLTINDGEIHAIMGPNGSGKSTLSGLLKEAKSTDTFQMKWRKRRKAVSICTRMSSSTLPLPLTLSLRICM